MHPALRLSNLSRLPPAMKRAALAACSTERSAQDLGRLRAFLPTSTDEQKRWMLPAFYFNLNPDDIPAEHGFDPETMSPVTESAIERAWSSLQSFYIIDFPLGIGTDTWPRVWKWYQFFHLFHGHLQGLSPIRLPESPLSVDLLMFSGTFNDDEPSYTLIKSTPGFWFMLGETWLHLTRSVDALKRDIIFGDLSGFIQAPEAVEPDNLAEIIEGVGGTLHELARVATLYLSLLVPTSPALTNLLTVQFVVSVLEFFKAIDPSLDERKGSSLRLGPFGIALISQNVVRALTDAICALTRSLIQGGDSLAMDGTAEIIRQIFNLLAIILVKSPGYQGLQMALKAGVLTAVATCMQLPAPLPPSLQQCMNHWAGVILPKHLVHHGVLTALGPALEVIADLVHTDAFRRSEAYEKWATFDSLARERLQILESRSSVETSSFRACDNLQCLKIQTKTSFERCSRFLSFYYCCRACQVTDWNAGHRDACASYGTLYLSEASKFHVPTRDRGFFRAFMNHDYRKAKITLLQEELLFRRAYPGEPYFLLYDYTNTVVNIHPQSVNITEPTDLAGVEWRDIISRVARSGGRMRLDVMVFSLADGLHWLAVPLRRSTSRVNATLGRLASELPNDPRMWDLRYVTETIASLAFPAELETH
ncbi:hypothetical protein B0H16DRAFT_1903760 [Mycena metata]|uniref:MYND-type domain-containing protein n=1 Tax=Mycena metata TaxID=1033252 RepID=A0AAD7DPX1_9AGAR|nr:hypothetical protein B0H16DRAFT_1903760 [Mycena metata]